MINKGEVSSVIIASLVIAFSITLITDLDLFLLALLSAFLLITANIIIKKFYAYHLDSEIEIKIWEVQRFGFKSNSHLKRAFPLGAFAPLISKIFLFPFNGFVWMASLVFDVKAKTYRAAKRHGMYSFSEMTEDHIGRIAAAGIFGNLILAILFYFVGGDFGILFARMNIGFAFFNLIPISDLDGNKILFGNLAVWSLLVILTLIGMGYSILLV